MESLQIDINYDVRQDSGGKDPDFASPTLRKYHKILWSKKLPNGQNLELIGNLPNHYLLGRTSKIEISLSSDTICNSYSKRKRMQSIIEPHSENIDGFRRQLYTVAGFILFPAKKVNGLNTINQERGWIKNIDDRFDLTLECIKRYYRNEQSPLFDVLNRYSIFFDLFVDFRGYVEYFLLQDLVSPDFSRVKFFLPGDIPNDNKALPRSNDEYLMFMQNAQAFLQGRNRRILEFSRMSVV